MLRCMMLACFTFASLLAASHADAGGKSDTKVKAKATATRPDKDGNQKVTITLTVDKNWYIYANPVGNEDFAENRTKVSIKAAKNLKVNVSYPPGKAKTEGKITNRIYEPAVEITALVQRAPGDTSPLEVSIDVNACRVENGRTMECLFPGVITLKIP